MMDQLCSKCKSDDIVFIEVVKEEYDYKTDSLIQLGKYKCGHCDNIILKELDEIYNPNEDSVDRDYTTDEITELYRRQLEGF